MQRRVDRLETRAGLSNAPRVYICYTGGGPGIDGWADGREPPDDLRPQDIVLEVVFVPDECPHCCPDGCPYGGAT